MRVPGGRKVALLVGGVGFLTTALSIGLALIPGGDEPNKVLAVTKVAGLTLLLVAAGAVVYVLGIRRVHARA
jgi:glutamate:GABA antiporter